LDRLGILRTSGVALGLVALVVGSGAVNGLADSQLTANTSTVTSTVFVNQLFDTNSVGTRWTLPSNPSFLQSANGACLTEDGTPSSSSSIHQCTDVSDTGTPGSLRLTNNDSQQLGTVFYSSSVPTSEGLVAKFNTYQYNYNSSNGDAGAADGIGFVLAAANPSDPTPPATGGSPGGALGYGIYPARTAGNNSEVDGIPNGYLGVGLDVYGNYLNPQYAGAGCTSLSDYSTSMRYPQAVTVKGPGDGTNGYCAIRTSGELPTDQSLDQAYSTSRPNTPVPVEVVINPTTSTTYTTSSGLSVSPGYYGVEFTPYGATTPVQLSGTLPTYAVSTKSPSEYCSTTDSSVCLPASWVNPNTGLPYQLTFGWTASTGGGNEYHEINGVVVDSVTPAPVLGLGITNTATSGDVQAGGSTNFVFSPSITLAPGAQESSAPTLQGTFPADVTPDYSNVNATHWNCRGSRGQSLDCTYTGTVSAEDPITSSESLPAITVPVTVSHQATTGSSLTVDGTLSSNDALPVNASSTVAVVAPTPTTVPAVVTPSNPSLSLTKIEASGSPNPITKAGQNVTYNFDATNTGNTTLNNLSVVDTQSVPGETLTGPISCPVTSLAAGASVICTGTYAVTSTDITDGAVTDTATATATDSTGTTVTSNPSTLTIPVSVPTTAPKVVTTKPTTVTPTTKSSSTSPAPVKLVTGPPVAPTNTTNALPIGIGIASLGIAGLAYVGIERKRKGRINYGTTDEVA
jgi:hypothetical protein